MKWPLCLIGIVCSLAIGAHVGYADSQVELVENRLYRVVKVVDGDTIKLENGQHIRLTGIDAPENRDGVKLRKDLKYRHSTKKVELAMGEKSQKFLKKLVEGKKVSLKFDFNKYDQYNRVLAYVYLTDGRFVNAEMLKNGYAYVVDIRPNIKYANSFKKLYEEAQKNDRGLWQNGEKNEKYLKWFSNN